MYRSGKGVAQDQTEAGNWFRIAADQGHMDAQYNIGRHYESGQGVPKDFEEAKRWYRGAADRGHGPAKKALAKLR
jgi:TPR repeat protein